MKTLGQLWVAAALTLVLTLSAIAEDGHMSAPTMVQPPPPATQTVGQVDVPPGSDSGSANAAAEGSIEDGVTEVLLNLIAGVLSLG